MTDQDHIERINALTRNARNTWFALLGVLVFVGITLMGVEHIDFYGVNRATKLPLVDVEVPTKSFFFAAPVLTAAIFGYFHLYLIRLWDALGAAPTRINGVRLGDAVSPWLVTDAALHLRHRLRGDNSTTPRTLEGGAMLLNFLLAWMFGLGILGWLWMTSMPARDILITGAAAITLLISIFAGASSLAMMWLRMKGGSDFEVGQMWSSVPAMASLVVLIPAGAAFSHLRTMGDAYSLASLDLSAQNLVETPSGWLPFDIARKDFLAVWCKREGVDCNDMTDAQQRDFASEWKIRRDNALTDLNKPDWHRSDTKPNLREADLSRAQLSGLNLSAAQMEGADLSFAKMEGTYLEKAQMAGTNLIFAQMEGADLSFAKMERVNLNGAEMAGADLSFAQMNGADLAGANMKGVNLGFAQMKGADLRGANMEGADLSFAQMEAANLSGTFLRGERNNPMYLAVKSLSATINNGGALRFVNLRPRIIDAKTDFRNAFMDGSVPLTEEFKAQMGGLCQRPKQVLDDEEFFGHWRGWVEKRPAFWNGPAGISPPGWEDVTPIPPPEGCEWKTGPMPGVTSVD